MISTAEFYREFPDEQACRNHLKQSREKEGICCKKCKSKEHYWLKSKNQWQCKKCSFRTTLTSGTLFHASNMGLFYWYQAMYFMNATQKALSAKEMQLKLGYKRYEPIWYMMHKIRMVMSGINSLIDYEEESYLANCSLLNKKINHNNDVEAFFSDIQEKYSNAILVKEKGQNSKKRNRIRFKVSPYSKRDLKEVKDSGIFYFRNSVSDTNISHRTAFNKRKNKIITVLDKLIENNSKWVKNIIENLKGVIYAIYHQVSAKYLQLYLDEFSYKYNISNVEERWRKLLFSGLQFYW